MRLYGSNCLGCDEYLYSPYVDETNEQDCSDDG